MLKKKLLILTMLLCLIGFATACENKITDANDFIVKDDDNHQSGESLMGTWVLIEKNINGAKELLPEDNNYPVLLIIYSTIDFRGRCDQNTYDGKHEINENNISFSIERATDGMGFPWYWDYISELGQTEKVLISSQDSDTSNMQLKLSNKENTITLYFINKKWFEEKYFILEEWYD